VIIHVALSTGWTIDYVGWNIDLPRLISLNKYWKKTPPVHVLFAAYVGYKEPDVVEIASTSEAVSEHQASIEEFMSSMPQHTFQPPMVMNNEH